MNRRDGRRAVVGCNVKFFVKAEQNEPGAPLMGRTRTIRLFRVSAFAGATADRRRERRTGGRARRCPNRAGQWIQLYGTPVLPNLNARLPNDRVRQTDGFARCEHDLQSVFANCGNHRRCVPHLISLPGLVKPSLISVAAAVSAFSRRRNRFVDYLSCVDVWATCERSRWVNSLASGGPLAHCLVEKIGP